MVFGIKVRFLFMLVTANLKASSSTLMGSFSSVSKMPPVGREETGGESICQQVLIERLHSTYYIPLPIMTFLKV